MLFHPMRFRTLVFCAAVLSACLVSAACSDISAPEVRTYGMGDRIELGKLVYNVIETRWLPQIGEGPTARIPRDRFLMLRMSIGNSGAGELLIPNLTLEGDKGDTYPQLSDGNGVPQFLGPLRPVTTAESASGNILFDAPAAHYKLRISDETGRRTALVDIPLAFRSETPDIPPPGAESK